MKATLEQCIKAQREFDAIVTHNKPYLPWEAGIGEVIEMREHLGHVSTWRTSDESNDQAYLELVDVFAFALSGVIIQGMDSALQRLEDYNKWGNYNIFSIPELIHMLYSRFIDASEKRHGYKDAIKICIELNNRLFGNSKETLYYIRLAKLELSKFRNSRGYNDPNIEYFKNWNGKEDNVYLFDMIGKVELDDIQAELGRIYDNVVKYK